MSRALVLGSRSAIGRKFIDSLDGAKLEPVAVSSQMCNLLDPASVDKLIEQLRPFTGTFRFAVQFSTTYGKDDVAMAVQVARLVNALSIPRLVFLSSWVVMLDKSLTSTGYIEAKRRCESFYRATWESEPQRLRIVRPSVVVGDRKLLHQRLLDLLALAPALIPHSLARCFVDVDEVVRATLAIALEEGEGLRTHCVLGPLRSVREAAGCSEPSTLLGRASHAALAPVRVWLGLLVSALAYVCCYFRGWLALLVTPQSEEDVLALCSPHNVKHVQVLGRGAIYKYYKQRFPGARRLRAAPRPALSQARCRALAPARPAAELPPRLAPPGAAPRRQAARQHAPPQGHRPPLRAERRRALGHDLCRPPGRPEIDRPHAPRAPKLQVHHRGRGGDGARARLLAQAPARQQLHPQRHVPLGRVRAAAPRPRTAPGGNLRPPTSRALNSCGPPNR